jgi:hypothetical protein
MNEYIREQLVAARVELDADDDRTTYTPVTKLMVANLMGMGENPTIMAEILGVDVAVIAGWYHQYVRRQDFALRNDELSFYRLTNKLVADARTRGCIVKACLEDNLLSADAALLCGVTITAIEKWKAMYASDYDAMISMKPGREIIVKPTYVLGLEAKEELQAIIYQHDREEGALAGQRRIEYLQHRND